MPNGAVKPLLTSGTGGQARETVFLRLADLLHNASHHLSNTAPEYSARYGLSHAQRAGLWSLFGAALIFMTLAPSALIIAATAVGAILFSINVFLRFTAAFAVLLRRRRKSQAIAKDVAPDLPRFSLLIPLYQEAAVVQQSVDAMAALDYPHDKLEVIYLTEADDHETITSLQACSGAADFQIVVIPDAPPRTKPRALNYGLGLATGDIITVYDAEDIPDPDQLRIAAQRFADGEDRLAVVQAVLSPYNPSDGWIARQFTLEYDIQFRVWSPFITALDWPLCIGGTSNHFRADVLRRAGGWDPYNVTEDADLSLRLALMGYSSAMIASRTHEEAPIRFSQWLAQRSRWVKGHLQTWLVITRRPLFQAGQLGLWRLLGLHLTFTLSLLAAFTHGPLFLLTIWRCLTPGGMETLVFLGLLFSGYLSAAAAAFAGARPGGRIWTLLTTPFYWPLQSLAALRALWEMQTDPHKWAKTQHGLSAPPDHIRESG